MNKPLRSLPDSLRQWQEIPGVWYAVLAGYLSVLFFLSLNPWVRPASGNSIFSPDKIDHAIAYGGLSVILFFCLIKSGSRHFRNTARAWTAALLLALLIGILVEVAQSLFTANRAGSIEDAAANAIGAGIGYIAFHLVKHLHRKK